MELDAVHVGIDIGQQHDPTAIVAAEVWTDPHALTRYLVKHMQRLPIGMSYPEQVAEIVKLFRAISKMLDARRRSMLDELAKHVAETGEQVSGPPEIDLRAYVDYTGVGRPVFDMLAWTLRADRVAALVDLRPITFRPGDKYDRETGMMGKGFLVSRLQVLLQNRQIALPANHPEADAMTKELKDYSIKVKQDANAEYGALSTGQHDDLVTGMGLATLEDPNGSGRGSLRFFELAR